MAALHESYVALRIHGDSLDPTEISRIMGCSPTKAYVKGQVQYKTKLYTTGGWLLDATVRAPGDFDAQVSELFSRVTKELTVWSNLSGKFVIDLFCGFFMKETNEGIELSAETMRMLSERGIKVGICLYAPTEDVQPTDSCPCRSGRAYADCCAPKPEV